MSEIFRLPKVGQVVMVDVGHAFMVPRRYLGLDPLGLQGHQPVFQDLETLRIHSGHCTWKPQIAVPEPYEPAVPAPEDPRQNQWINSRVKLPPVGTDVWFVHNFCGTVKTVVAGHVAGIDERGHPLIDSNAHNITFEGWRLWQPLVKPAPPL